jgi:hypothetical protein
MSKKKGWEGTGEEVCRLQTNGKHKKKLSEEEVDLDYQLGRNFPLMSQTRRENCLLLNQTVWHSKKFRGLKIRVSKINRESGDKYERKQGSG